MRRTLCLVCALICTAATPAFATRFVDAAAAYPGAPQPVYDDPPPTPYPMNYSEETAMALGTRAGGIDLFAAPRAGGMAPAVSVGSGAGAPMLKLQWRP